MEEQLNLIKKYKNPNNEIIKNIKRIQTFLREKKIVSKIRQEDTIKLLRKMLYIYKRNNLHRVWNSFKATCFETKKVSVKKPKSKSLVVSQEVTVCYTSARNDEILFITGFDLLNEDNILKAIKILKIGPLYSLSDSCKNDDYNIWDKLLNNEIKSYHYENLLGNYKVIYNIACSLKIRDLLNYYPKSKVIVMKHIKTDDNYQNFKHNYKNRILYPGLKHKLLNMFFTEERRKNNLIKLVYSKMFNGDVNKNSFCSFINNQKKLLKEILPKDRFLSFDLKKGWHPLCSFLNVKVPLEKFPYIEYETDEEDEYEDSNGSYISFASLGLMTISSLISIASIIYYYKYINK